MNNYHNDCFAPASFPSFMLCGICSHALDISACVMLHDQISSVALIFFISNAIAWVIMHMGVYTALGRYDVQSGELKRHCKMHCQTKMDSRQVRALRPLKMRAGQGFSVKRDTVLGIILTVTGVTVNAILII